MINKIKTILKNWQIKKISDLLDYERPDKYIVKSTAYSDKFKIPVLTANKSFVLGYTDEDFGIYENVPAIIFDDFTTDSKYVDFPFKVKSSAIKILRSRSEDVNIKFVYEKMKFIKFPVGNHKRYYISQYQDLEVAVPPILEQTKIAEILSTVDEDIEKTDQIIKETEKMKKGLMQDLLTKGIGHKKFKKTKLGKIPEEWEVVKIENSGIALIDGDRGVNYPKLKDFFDKEYCLFLSNKNIKNDRFVFNESSFISKEKDEKLRKGKLEREDIILTSRGTVGNVAYYNSQIPFENIRINSGMLILRHGKNYNPLFLYKLLSGPFMKQRYKDMGSGSAQPQLPIKSLEQIEIPLLPKEEQKQIAEILSEIDNKIEINKLIKNKLTQLKKGLMQDLLSGRVRVN